MDEDWCRELWVEVDESGCLDVWKWMGKRVEVGWSGFRSGWGKGMGKLEVDGILNGSG